MIFIYIIIVLAGFLPLTIILWKMKKLKNMKKFGVQSTATVTQLFGRTYKGLNKVMIDYPVWETASVHSKHIIVAGVPYSQGDKLTIYYKRGNPDKMVLDQGKSWALPLVFTSIIAAFYIFACYMVYKGVQSGEL